MVGLSIKLTAVAINARGTKVINVKSQLGRSSKRTFNSQNLLQRFVEEGGLGARV